MYKTHKRGNIEWLDFTGDDKIDFPKIAAEKDIDSYVVDKFTSPNDRDRAFISGDNLFLCMHFPDLDQETLEYGLQEINFVIGKDYIITGKQKNSEGLLDYEQKFLQKADSKHFFPEEEFVAYPIVRMIERIYENILLELNDIEDYIELIEENIFQDREKQMVVQISEINRTLIDFRRTIRTHRQTWSVFTDVAHRFFKRESTYDILDTVTISYEKVYSKAEELKELLWELRDTNNSLLSAKLSDSSKTFTLIAFLTLPITLFISIISIPTKQSHLFLGHENDFSLTLAISFIIFSVTLAISVYKKWW
jgi:magnesium transporter